MRRAAWLVVLLLAGCASHEAKRARRQMPGMSELALLSCAGPPDRVLVVDPGVQILTYSRAAKGVGLKVSFPLIGGGLDLSSGGDCKAVVRVRDGTVAALHFTGADGGMSGADAVCAPLVRECLKHPEHIAQPADFDPARLGTEPKAQSAPSRGDP